MGSRTPATVQASQGLAEGSGRYGLDGNAYALRGDPLGTPVPRSSALRDIPYIGIPTELRNAVKVIVPFYSDTATSERAAAFWSSFERCTYGMDDQMRLTAFEQCLMGKVDQAWWYNSVIRDFETLRVKLYNRFICQTPGQLWERLKTAKRNRGESAEEWGDRIAKMCDALNYHEPRMRFEFFLGGIRNKQLRATLNASMVTTIPEACSLLLYKNLHLPVEEDDEFAGEGTPPAGMGVVASTQSQMLQQLQLMNQTMQKQLQNPGMNHGHISAVAPAATPSAPGVPPSDGGRGATLGPLRIRLGPDTRTTEGEVVCGRCERKGCSRENCPRGKGRCNRCQCEGHFSMECNWPKPQGGNRREPECFFCHVKGHTVTRCNELGKLRGLLGTLPSDGTPATTIKSQQ
eukprot:jgi/Phyca11/131854/e_gw1.118.16.1